MTDINDIKRELEALTAKVAAYEAEKATKRNWPERIEAGDCFEQANGSRYLVCGSKFVNLDTGALWLLGGGPSGNDKTDLSYLGKIDLTIRTDAHEPTGAELVGVLEDIRSVSNNPGRTLTTLGLAECLQSCNVMARKALEGLAK